MCVCVCVYFSSLVPFISSSLPISFLLSSHPLPAVLTYLLLVLNNQETKQRQCCFLSSSFRYTAVFVMMQCHFIMAGCLVCLPQNEWVCDIEMDSERGSRRQRESEQWRGALWLRVCLRTCVFVYVCVCSGTRGSDQQLLSSSTLRQNQTDQRTVTHTSAHTQRQQTNFLY